MNHVVLFSVGWARELSCLAEAYNQASSVLHELALYAGPENDNEYP